MLASARGQSPVEHRSNCRANSRPGERFRGRDLEVIRARNQDDADRVAGARGHLLVCPHERKRHELFVRSYDDQLRNAASPAVRRNPGRVSRWRFAIPAKVDVVGLIIAIVGAVAFALLVSWIGYLLGVPTGILGALTTALVAALVVLIYTRRQRRRAARFEDEDSSTPP